MAENWNKSALAKRARKLGITCNASWTPEQLREAIRKILYGEPGSRLTEQRNEQKDCH